MHQLHTKSVQILCTWTQWRAHHILCTHFLGAFLGRVIVLYLHLLKDLHHIIFEHYIYSFLCAVTFLHLHLVRGPHHILWAHFLCTFLCEVTFLAFVPRSWPRFQWTVFFVHSDIFALSVPTSFYVHRVTFFVLALKIWVHWSFCIYTWWRVTTTWQE